MRLLQARFWIIHLSKKFRKYVAGSEGMPQELAAIYVSCHLNLSQAALNMSEWPAAKDGVLFFKKSEKKSRAFFLQFFKKSRARPHALFDSYSSKKVSSETRVRFGL